MSSPSTAVRFSVADTKPSARKRLGTPGFVRAALLGALTGVSLAALVAGSLWACSVPVTGIEADAFSDYLGDLRQPTTDSR